MISLPHATFVHQRIPKEAFYKRLNLSSALKERFVSDIETIYVENSLTKAHLNLLEEAKITEILVVSIVLKKQEYDHRLLEAIARQNPHKLVFLLCYRDQQQLAVVYKGRLYRSVWRPKEDSMLEARGFHMGEVWESLVEQIALPDEKGVQSDKLTLEERLASQEKREKLEKQIAALQAKIRKEKQLNKQVKLNAELKKLKKELEEA
jgi:hypothetical protein